MDNIQGLNAHEVDESRQKYGSNRLTKRKKKSIFRQFLENLGDPVIRVLLCALAINILFLFKRADWFETGGIAAAVFLATFISTLSEYGSEAAFQKLYDESSERRCLVRRSGAVKELPTSELVVGDRVIIGAGEGIPADGRIVSGKLGVDQSAMTGENREVGKCPGKPGDSTPSDPTMLLCGTVVLSGEGEFVVTAVGDETALGGISREIQTDTRPSPLKIRLTKLASVISKIGYAAAGLVALAYLVNTFVIDCRFDPAVMIGRLTDWQFLLENLMHALTLALTVIVVAVPEGLPMMIAVVLSANIRRMVKDSVLVRKPTGIEAAGSMNILFTDKTGTLTEGKLSVVSVVTPFGEEKKLPGGVVGELIKLHAMNNCASIPGSGGAIGGNPTDRALVEFAKPSGRGEPIGKSLFDSTRKYSAAAVRDGGEVRTLIKGAPEILLPHAIDFIGADRKKHEFLNRPAFESKLKNYAAGGFRLILLAEASGNKLAELERGEIPKLTIHCVLLIRDNLRRAALSSVKALRKAGIGVVMITGDSPDTGAAIAKECGILSGERDIVLTGSELSRYSDLKLGELLPRLAVVARALPSDKSRLVRVAQERELVVGMTGDGINDAPALKRADIGFALGSGTQVAREAGDIIILDNDLKSIVKAVLYGRNIFKSIRKFITLQLTMNFSAVGVSMICPFLGIDAPVTVVQMLWINIIMDTLGGLAFAGEAPLPWIMNEPPKRRDEPILNSYMANQIIVLGGFTVALSIYFLKNRTVTSLFRSAPDDIYLLTAFFALFIFAGVFNCFNCRTDRLNLFAGISKNPAFTAIMTLVATVQILFVYLGGAVLRTAPLTVSELLYSLAFAALVFPAEIIRKLIWRIAFKKGGF